MVDSHKCIVDPDSIGYIGYMKERKLALCDGNCIVCGKEILRALRPIHNASSECKDGCCRDDFHEDEWAFQYPAQSFIQEFTSMPWTHYQVDPKNHMVNDSVTLSTYSSNPNLAGINVSGGTGMELYYE